MAGSEGARGAVTRQARLLLRALVLGPGLAACGGASAPRVDHVSPEVILEGEGVTLAIHGANFTWRYDGFADRVEGGLVARVADVRLEDLEWVDTTELRARLPSGLAPGRYAVVVASESGEGTKGEALTVIAAPAQEDGVDAATGP